MSRNTTLALIIALPLGLAACATPQESCISRNTDEYRTVSRLLAEVEGNLSRGYAWQERQVVRSRPSQCRQLRRDKNGEEYVRTYTCWQDYVDNERYRVPIDPASETRKRDNLAERQLALGTRAKAAVDACRTAYPDDAA